jgi:acetyl-CoA carboxylase carboxyl transferase subunit beta
MSWFIRKEKGINTPTEMKREAPDGLWYQCPNCKKITPTREHKQKCFYLPALQLPRESGVGCVFQSAFR